MGLLLKLLAAAAGVVVAFVLLIGVTAVARPAAGPDNWDLATPLLLIGASLPVAALGAVGGWMVVGYLRADRWRAALMTILFTGGPVVVIALAIAFPQAWIRFPAPTPVGSRGRAEWAEWTKDVQEIHGRGLAGQVEGGIRKPFGGKAAEALLSRRPTLDRTWYAYGPDSIAALGGYRGMDEGWRWEIVRDGYPPRIIVFPDPVFGRDGPVFDVQPNRILRKATRDAPGFVIDTTVPHLVRLHACVLRIARNTRRDRRWDGAGATLGAVIAALDTVPEECPQMHVWQRPDDPGEWWAFDISLGDASPRLARFEIRAVDEGGATPFALLAWADGVAYMVDETGAWHMRAGAEPSRLDPPPPPCLFDPRLPCD